MTWPRPSPQHALALFPTPGDRRVTANPHFQGIAPDPVGCLSVSMTATHTFRGEPPKVWVRSQQWRARGGLADQFEDGALVEGGVDLVAEEVCFVVGEGSV